MSLFQFIYKTITPKDVNVRYNPFIEHLCSMNPGLSRLRVSNEEVTLIQSENNISFEFKQLYNSGAKILHVTYCSHIENTPVKVEISFNDSMDQGKMFWELMEAIGKKVRSIYEELAENEEKDAAHLKSTQNIKQNAEATKKANNAAKERQRNYDLDSLSLNQKKALLGMLMYLYNGCEIERQKEAANIISSFTDTIDLDKKYIREIPSKQSWESREKYANEIKSIHKDEPLIQFILACKELLNLDDSIFADYTFHDTLKMIGFSSEEIEAIENNEYIYKFDNSDSKEVNKSNGVKEEESLFTESWDLTEFAKQYDKIQVGTFTNKDTRKTFKACIFTKGELKTYVSFFSQLGVLTPQEIADRKRELKVGKTSDNKYYLYSSIDNITMWKNVNLET